MELLRHNDVDSRLFKSKTYTIKKTEFLIIVQHTSKKIHDNIIMSSGQNIIFLQENQIGVYSL